MTSYWESMSLSLGKSAKLPTCHTSNPNIDEGEIVFRDHAALDVHVRDAVALALQSAADDFQKLWPLYGDDWLRARAATIKAGTDPIGEHPPATHSRIAEGDEIPEAGE